MAKGVSDELVYTVSDSYATSLESVDISKLKFHERLAGQLKRASTNA